MQFIISLYTVAVLDGLVEWAGDTLYGSKRFARLGTEDDVDRVTCVW